MGSNPLPATDRFEVNITLNWDQLNDLVCSEKGLAARLSKKIYEGWFPWYEF